jgi:hypothetical protein
MYQDIPDGSNSHQPADWGRDSSNRDPGPDAAAEREWRLARYARTMAR